MQPFIASQVSTFGHGVDTGTWLAMNFLSNGEVSEWFIVTVLKTVDQ